MAIFSRRTLHRLIKENSRFLDKDQTARHVSHLNRFDGHYLDFEWEVVLLNALSKFGQVIHERAFGARHPDIFFLSNTDAKQSFIAEIATVSDEGLDKENPVKAFNDEFRRIIERWGLRWERFSCDVNKTPEAFYRGKKTKHRIPPRGRFYKDFFSKSEFKQFLSNITRNPQVPAEYRVKTEAIDVEMRYNPAQTQYTSSYPVHAFANSLKNNPIYNALRGKARKLKEAVYDGPRGIILCDGGCEMFHYKETPWMNRGAESVINDILRQEKRIDFILTISVERGCYTTDFNRICQLTVNLYRNTAFELLGVDIKNCLENIRQAIPAPIFDAENTLHNIQQGNYSHLGWSYFYGSLLMSEDRKEIKISARELLDLLAGRLEQKEFFESQGFASSEGVAPKRENPFEANLEQHRLIDRIKLVRTETDDDYIVITFGDPDPAISPFVAPENAE